MSTKYSVTSPNGVLLGEGTSIEEIVDLVRSAQPGRYRVEIVKLDAQPAENSARIWGEVIKTPRGRIKLSAPPWAD